MKFIKGQCVYFKKYVCIWGCGRAKSLQSCTTLCDPMDCSLSGSSAHGDSPGKNTVVGCHALLRVSSQPRVHFSSVTQSCPTLWDPMNRSMPGLPVHHQLPEYTQTHVHWVGDAIQPSHPLLSPSPPALNLSQHQGLFKWVSSSHQVAKVLEFQLQHQSFQWTPRTDLLAVQGTLKSLLQHHSSRKQWVWVRESVCTC